MKQEIEDMLSRHPEGLTAYQLSALTRKSESTIYMQLRKMRKNGAVTTDQAWDVTRNPTIYRLRR